MQILLNPAEGVSGIEAFQKGRAWSAGETDLALDGEAKLLLHLFSAGSSLIRGIGCSQRFAPWRRGRFAALGDGPVNTCATVHDRPLFLIQSLACVLKYTAFDLFFDFPHRNQILVPTLANFLPAIDLDNQMTALMTALPGANPPEGGWLRAVRQELALTQSTVAKAAGLTQQAYAQFEQGEARGTLSLGNLQRSAAAMDCDVVYFLVPRANRGRPFGELATRIAQDSGPAPAEKSTVPPGEQPASAVALPGFTLNLVHDHHIL